jgi:hypothetical protein
MKRFRILLLVLAGCFATASLQGPVSATKDWTYQAYDGPALAANQVAVLELQKPSRQLGFVSVDGKSVLRNWDGSLREDCKLNEFGGGYDANASPLPYKYFRASTRSFSLSSMGAEYPAVLRIRLALSQRTFLWRRVRHM